MKTANPNKTAFTVGIFIFIGIAILITMVLTLGGQKKIFQNSVTVKAVFDDVQGLQKGNNVWFSGVKIGTVKRIAFYGTSQVEVDLDVQKTSVQYIRSDSKAKISSDGLIGNKIVVIYGGNVNQPVVVEGDLLTVEKAVSTEEMLGTLQKNNVNLLEITGDFKTISNRLNKGEGTIGKLLTDETLVNDLQQVMTTLQSAATNTQRLTNTLSSYTARLNKKGTLANELVNDTILYANLKSSAVQIEEITKTGQAVINDLQQASTTLGKNLKNPNTPIGVLLINENVGTELKSTMRSLNSSSQKLDENLEALQHNFLLRGFFRKKEKREKEGEAVRQ